MLYAIHFSLCLGYIAGMQCVGLCHMAGLASAKLLSGHHGAHAPFLSKIELWERNGSLNLFNCVLWV